MARLATAGSSALSCSSVLTERVCHGGVVNRSGAMRQLLRASWLLLALPGCAATFVDVRVKPGEEKTQWAHFYVLGALGEAEVDVRDHCPTARAHAVWVGEDVFTLAVSVVTLGIYTPRKVAVTCEKVP